jgi:hypothetical protein
VCVCVCVHSRLGAEVSILVDDRADHLVHELLCGWVRAWVGWESLVGWCANTYSKTRRRSAPCQILFPSQVQLRNTTYNAHKDTNVKPRRTRVDERPVEVEDDVRHVGCHLFCLQCGTLWVGDEKGERGQQKEKRKRAKKPHKK